VRRGEGGEWKEEGGRKGIRKIDFEAALPHLFDPHVTWSLEHSTIMEQHCLLCSDLLYLLYPSLRYMLIRIHI
jgi:hypothetical protein